MKQGLSLLAAALFIAHTLSGCAAETTQPSDGSNNDTGEGTDTDERDIAEPDDTAEGDTAEPDADDDATPDTGSDDVDSPDAAEEVSPVDVGLPNGCDALATDCEPYTSICDEERGSLTVCGRCGNILTIEVCDSGFICDDEDGTGECRECAAGECDIEPTCEPNELFCLDYRTQARCNPDGTVGTTQPCVDGRRCTPDGSCGPPGAPTGAPCTLDSDPTVGCVGQFCLCSEEDQTGGATGCSGELATGYCSTADCSLTGCDTTREICATFEASGRYDGQSFCMLDGGCINPGRPCGTRPGFVCQEFPTVGTGSARGEWALGCWPDLGLARIGDTCENASSCSGGLCVLGTGPSRPSYCSSLCGADSDCPSNAECVEDPNNPSRYICLARANVTDCPRLGEDFSIRSVQGAIFGGGRASVCYIP